MRRLRRAALGVADFVIGDDWRIALGVAVALGVTAILATSTFSAWWVLPVAVVGLLGFSLARARP
jgi:O-antigen ligase